MVGDSVQGRWTIGVYDDTGDQPQYAGSPDLWVPVVPCDAEAVERARVAVNEFPESLLRKVNEGHPWAEEELVRAVFRAAARERGECRFHAGRAESVRKRRRREVDVDGVLFGVVMVLAVVFLIVYAVKVLT